MKKLVFFIVLSLIIGLAWGQSNLINEGFESTSFPPTGWTNSGTIRSTNSYRTGAASLAFNGVSDAIYTPQLSNPNQLSFWYRRSSNTTAWTLNVQVSTNATNWSSIGTITNASETYQEFTYDLSSYSGIYVRMLDQRSTGTNERYVDDFTVTALATGPSITATPSTLTGFTYVYGSGPSTQLKTYSLSGTSLSPSSGNIAVACLTNYEISTDNANFSSSLGVPYTTSTLASTTIYVRLKAGLVVGTYNGETISNSGGGATTQNVTCSGSVTAPPYVPISLGNTVSESFAIGTSGTAALPGGWTVDKNTTVRTVGTFSGAVSNTDYAASTSMTTNGIYNFGDSITPADRAVGGLSSSDNSKSVNLYVKLLNNGSSAIPSWRISYNVEKYRNGSNAAGFTIQMYYSTDGTNWTSAGDDFKTSYNADGNNNGFDPAPGSTTSVTNKVLVSSVAANGNLYLAWNYSVSSGTTTSNAQALGIDDVSIEAYEIQYVAAPTFDPVAGTYLTSQNVSLSSTTDGASFKYSTTSATGPWTDYSGPIAVNATTTIWAYAYKSGMTDSNVVSATYTLPTDVSNIAALRAGTVGATPYRLTGEAILTFQQSTRNQKYIQDATGAILIDDVTAKITTTYSLYDGITGLVGTLSLYNGLLQFLPLADPGAATSSDNEVIPEVRTLSSLTSDDQAKLIKVLGVTIDPATVNFGTTAENINVTQGTTTITLRTFPSTDYSNTAIPVGPIDMVCLVGQFNTSMQVSPRFLADFTEYDYPNGVEIVIGDYAITVTGGSANNSQAQPTTAPNPSFIPNFTQVITLYGDGPWTITIETTDPWVVYRQGSNWYAYENTTGTVQFVVYAAKDAEIEIQSGEGGNPTLPVVLSSFTATLTAHNYVQLTWVTQTETGVQGYYIFRSGVNDLGTAQMVSTMIPATNTSQQQSYIFVDSELFEEGLYYYWLQNTDFDGSSSFHGPVSIQYTTGGGNGGAPNIPLSTQLKAAYPNPFNPSTRIPYDLAKGADVKIHIYNSRGQLVRSFPIGAKDAGSYYIDWNGKNDKGEDCATGVYYIRMQAGDKQFNSKAVLMK